MNVLVVFSHPTLEKSVANALIIEQLQQRVDALEIRHLEAIYPDARIDVAAEHEAVRKADLIILQHPFFWYSVPGLLKQWLDDVFCLGFAYGKGGNQLVGKFLLQSVTIGGSATSYRPNGSNHFRIEELLKPMEQTAYFTGMIPLPPIYSHECHAIPQVKSSLMQVRERALAHADRLIDFIETQRRIPQQDIETFMQTWFRHFDQFDDHSYFRQYLAPDVHMRLPNVGDIHGHEGFNQWYTGICENVACPSRHKFFDVQIQAEGKHFLVAFNMDFEGQDKTSQAPLHMHLRNTWRLSWNRQTARPIIHEYFVELQA